MERETIPRTIKEKRNHSGLKKCCLFVQVLPYSHVTGNNNRATCTRKSADPILITTLINWAVFLRADDGGVFGIILLRQTCKHFDYGSRDIFVERNFQAALFNSFSKLIASSTRAFGISNQRATVATESTSAALANVLVGIPLSRRIGRPKAHFG